MKINFNNYVWVRLTPIAKGFIRHNCRDKQREIPQIQKELQEELDQRLANEWTRWQLWELMEEFAGWGAWQGKDPPFIDNEMLTVDPTKAPEVSNA